MLQPYTKPKYFMFFFLLLVMPSILCASTYRFDSGEDFYSYIGGDNNESVYSIALDSEQNIYLAGTTNSDTFDEFNLVHSKTQFNQNCFVLKISSSDPKGDFLYEFSGSQRETCREIAIDSENNIYLTGETQSDDLPVTTNRTFSGKWDSFLFKLSSDGELMYATYIGGSLTDYGHGLAIKSVDQVYISGETWSTDFPTTQNGFMPNCEETTSCNGSKSNAFLTHIDTSNRFTYSSQYSTYIGGSDQDKAHDLSIDNNGYLHVVGETRSVDFPLKNQLQNTINGTYDGFLAVLNPFAPQSEALTMSTYIGGSKSDFIFAVTTDANGNSYLSGETWSDDFPVSSSAFSSNCAKGGSNCNPVNSFDAHSDAFVMIISHTAAVSHRILYSSLFGGSNEDIAQDILVENNKVVITGTTWSDDFPITTNASKTICNNISIECKKYSDGFILQIDLDQENDTGLIYSSYIGGGNDDSVFSMVQVNNTDSETFLNTEFFVSGETYSTNMPTSNTIDSQIQNGEAYIQKITISGEGEWINNTKTKPAASPKRRLASALSLEFLIFLIFIGVSIKLRSYSCGIVK